MANWLPPILSVTITKVIGTKINWDFGSRNTSWAHAVKPGTACPGDPRRVERQVSSYVTGATGRGRNLSARASRDGAG
jgi:hypothetical protein